MSMNRRRRGIPKSKRIKNNPFAVKGRKVAAYEGGVITTRRNADGTVYRFFTDEQGRRFPLDEEVTNASHAKCRRFESGRPLHKKAYGITENGPSHGGAVRVSGRQVHRKFTGREEPDWGGRGRHRESLLSTDPRQIATSALGTT